MFLHSFTGSFFFAHACGVVQRQPFSLWHFCWHFHLKSGHVGGKGGGGNGDEGGGDGGGKGEGGGGLGDGGGGDGGGNGCSGGCGGGLGDGGDGARPMMLFAVSSKPLRSALARVASVKSILEEA